QAYRRTGVQAFRRSGVQAFRRSGVQAGSIFRFAQNLEAMSVPPGLARRWSIQVVPINRYTDTPINQTQAMSLTSFAKAMAVPPGLTWRW
ncbi:MAG: hypothetical protein GY751_14760, partial [Bacteroidetes bacterium]|nr:hypothetical protein [Bacteroidota bacterium]